MDQVNDGPHILYEVKDGIGTITINRPELRNSHSSQMCAGLLQATLAAECDGEVRCVVLRGAGSCFTAGGDIPSYEAAIGADPEAHRASFVRQVEDWHHIISRLRDMPKPVLASVHGTCFGFGFSLVLACDLAIASSDAIFMLPHRHIAMAPDAGLTYFLPRLVGERRALELALLGGAFDANAALQMGILNWLTEADALAERTAKLARQLSAGPPLALAQTKRLLRTSFDHDRDSQTERERDAADLLAGTEDHREGVAAFVAKRRANYAGR